MGQDRPMPGGASCPMRVRSSLRSKPSDPKPTARRVCSRAACALAPSPALRWPFCPRPSPDSRTLIPMWRLCCWRSPAKAAAAGGMAAGSDGRCSVGADQALRPCGQFCLERIKIALQLPELCFGWTVWQDKADFREKLREGYFRSNPRFEQGFHIISSRDARQSVTINGVGEWDLCVPRQCLTTMPPSEDVLPRQGHRLQHSEASTSFPACR